MDNETIENWKEIRTFLKELETKINDRIFECLNKDENMKKYLNSEKWKDLDISFKVFYVLPLKYVLCTPHNPKANDLPVGYRVTENYRNLQIPYEEERFIDYAVESALTYVYIECYEEFENE